MYKILVLHGPNLNLLGIREPELYGHCTLKDINSRLEQKAQQAQLSLSCFQSNHEGELIDALHQALMDHVDYIIFNPAAFTHTSIALRDALCAVKIPFIEVHLSAVYARESFRHQSYFSDIARGTITGFGAPSYYLALTQIIDELERHS